MTTSWHRLEHVPDEGRVHTEVVEGRAICVTRSGGKVGALDNHCPHQGGPLADGPIDGTWVTCPWHGWQFCVRTGDSTLNSRLKQPVFEVKVEGQDVLVKVG